MCMKYPSLVLVSMFLCGHAFAFESAEYERLEKDGSVEVRSYSPMWLAETQVDGLSFDLSGDEGFKFAGNYMFGANRPAGTSPGAASAQVNPEDRPGKKLGITSPVMMEPVGGGYRVSFLIPAKFTEENLPVPTHSKVSFRKVLARRIVAIKYSGDWSEANFRSKEAELRNWIQKKGVHVREPAIFARYDPPFWPKFMRRNEVWFEVVLSSVAGAK